MFRRHKRPVEESTDAGEKRARLSKAPMYSPYRLGRAQDKHKQWAALGAWFLGPKAENGDVFRDLLTRAVDKHVGFRHNYFPSDPPYVTDELREAASFQNAMQKLTSEMDSLQTELQNSVPFFSSRYKGHVLWETAMPANLGYMSAMLFNQNNCAAEASTVTTKFEVEVGKDLSVMMGYDGGQAMGHLTAGGSVANIEAIWAGRNVKYFPLGLQEALIKEERLADARGYRVNFPQKGEAEVTSASQWELLNLDVDTILKMPEEVQNLTRLKHQDFMEIMGSYLYESVGAQEFARRHMLTQSPCVIAPSTAHISFTKAVTVLGLGRESLVTVAVDEDARMEPKELERILKEKLDNEIPVITVVSVMGTTEESAVDPLTEILELRKQFRTKGLNFSIHGDGAWGGYFCSMLRNRFKVNANQQEEEGFVPELYLSSFVHKQISAMNQCDTITIDPHKSGFCPYPAGALCYRDKTMNTFLQITTTVVYYHGDMTLGDIGIEGSKPGAAAAGVMLANRVIGLDKQGYGRILAQCMFTAKIMYCLWVTLAEKDDNFVIETTKPLPKKYKKMSRKEQMEFIKERILGKSNEELIQDKEAMEYLKEVGPDTMIPCFSVNLKENKNVEKCNEINLALFQDLAHTSSEQTAHRIPMIVTSSSLVPHKHSVAVKNFKERLGLHSNNDKAVKYIITTCMDPWATSMEFMDDMAAIVRNSILCAIGTVTDPKALHNFVSTGVVNQNKEVIASYVGDFKDVGKQYDTVVKLQFLNDKDAEKYTAMQEKLLRSSKEPQPIVFRSKKDKHHDVFFEKSEYAGEKEKFDCFIGLPSDHDNNHFMTVKMKIADVARYQHFDNGDYPDASTYFMYGDKTSVFLFHIPTKSPDFFQMVQMDGPPEGVGSEEVDDLLLRYGTEVEFPAIPGTPVIANGEVQDPLTKTKYDITFVGMNGEEVNTKVKIARKIWFAGTTAK